MSNLFKALIITILFISNTATSEVCWNRSDSDIKDFQKSAFIGRIKINSIDYFIDHELIQFSTIIVFKGNEITSFKSVIHKVGDVEEGHCLDTYFKINEEYLIYIKYENGTYIFYPGDTRFPFDETYDLHAKILLNLTNLSNNQYHLENVKEEKFCESYEPFRDQREAAYHELDYNKISNELSTISTKNLIKKFGLYKIIISEIGEINEILTLVSFNQDTDQSITDILLEYPIRTCSENKKQVIFVPVFYQPDTVKVGPHLSMNL